MALKEMLFNSSVLTIGHVELEDNGARMQGEPLADMRIKPRIAFDNYHPPGCPQTAAYRSSTEVSLSSALGLGTKEHAHYNGPHLKVTGSSGSGRSTILLMERLGGSTLPLHPSESLPFLSETLYTLCQFN